jgi:uncharacterized membrane protein YuzA (DUF378 family)
MKFDLDFVVKLLVIIGGLNWLLVGAINLDLVQTIFGSIPMLAQAVYIIVGLCALYMLYMMFTEK